MVVVSPTNTHTGGVGWGVTHGKWTPRSVWAGQCCLEGVALSEVAENDSGQNLFLMRKHTKQTQGTVTIAPLSVINKRRVPAWQPFSSFSTLQLFFFSFFFFLDKPFIPNVDETKMGCSRLFCESTSDAGEGLFVSHMFLFSLISLYISSIHPQYLFLFFLWSVNISLPPSLHSPHSSSYYKILLQTWQRLTLERSWPPFRVSCTGE